MNPITLMPTLLGIGLIAAALYIAWAVRVWQHLLRARKQPKPTQLRTQAIKWRREALPRVTGFTEEEYARISAHKAVRYAGDKEAGLNWRNN
jgi:hypothetical protein